MSKIILDLCGGTGSWSKPYKDADYDVRLITLPEYDVTKYEPPENVYGILSAPPCTMFSLARQTAKQPRDFKKGMETVEACLRIVWQCRQQGTLRFWALENPVGFLRQFMGIPPLTFQPSDYGDPYTKRTDLWGYYKRPNMKRVKPIMGRDYEITLERPIDHRPPDMSNRQIRRSMTPQGFAKAFMEANK